MTESRKNEKAHQMYGMNMSYVPYLTPDGYFYTRCPECGQMTLRGKDEGDRVVYRCMGPKCSYREVKREDDGSGAVFAAFLVLLVMAFLVYACAA